MSYLGLDIGGANLKAADGRGQAVQIPFPLWKTPDRLAEQLRSMIAALGEATPLAVTMTGELCDCFATKSDGVRHILRAVREAAGSRSIRVWSVEGRFSSIDEAESDPLRAAAANWLALATFAGRMLSGRGLLIDLGSTTCDVIPIQSGLPIPAGRTDPSRLRSGELVYCGVRRTPLCAVFGLDKAAEWFATTEDSYVVLGDLPEDAARNDSADGRPVTVANALARLARMECDEGWSLDRGRRFAEDAKRRQVDRLAASVRRVANAPVDGVVMAGAGEFLIPAILEAAGFGHVPRVSLAERLGPNLSTAACAHAVAVLAEEGR